MQSDQFFFFNPRLQFMNLCSSCSITQSVPINFWIMSSWIYVFTEHSAHQPILKSRCWNKLWRFINQESISSFLFILRTLLRLKIQICDLFLFLLCIWILNSWIVMFWSGSILHICWLFCKCLQSRIKFGIQLNFYLSPLPWPIFCIDED